MARARFGALLPVVILVSLLTSPAFARDGGRWALSLGAGLTNEFTYRDLSDNSGGYREGFGFSGLAVGGAAYRLSDHLFLRADAGYLGYQKTLRINVAEPTNGTPDTWPTGSLGTQMPFVGAGVRLYTTGPASMTPRAYIEAMPTLWVARWRERVETPGHYDLAGTYYPSRVDQDAFTTLDPGFSAGVGLVGRLVGPTKVDLGLRYLFSVGPGQHRLGQYSSGEFNGLRQLSLVLRLHAPI
jgi:hypothetical protein